MLYNGLLRSQCNPWNPKRPLLKWKTANGSRCPGRTGAPMSDKVKGKLPFIMKPDGRAFLFGPGLADGPFPSSTNPMKNPLGKNPMSAQVTNPCSRSSRATWTRWLQQTRNSLLYAAPNTITEHWCSGSMTRWQRGPGGSTRAFR